MMFNAMYREMTVQCGIMPSPHYRDYELFGTIATSEKIFDIITPKITTQVMSLRVGSTVLRMF